MKSTGVPAAACAQGHEILNLQHTLARANASRIAEIVTLLDNLPDRGAADALLAPLRARLQQVWPPRAMSFTRLLFTPANPVLVPAARWRRNRVTIPRSALRCLSNQIYREIGHASDIEASIAGITAIDHSRILQVGAELWPLAAPIFAVSRAPDDWAEQTGLTASDYATIARPLAALLHEAVAIEAFANNAAAGAPVIRSQIRDCLSRAIEGVGGKAAPLQPIGMLIGTLLARLPVPEVVLVAAGDLAQVSQDPTIRQAADCAIDSLLEASEAMLADQRDLGLAAGELRRLLVLLDTLDKPGPAGRPARKPALASLRHDLDMMCRKRFHREMEKSLQSAREHSGNAPDDVEQGLLESTMRQLRGFEAASRCFGGGSSYDQAIRAAAAALAALRPAAETACDVARLIEILDGPEAGLAFLMQPQSRSP